MGSAKPRDNRRPNLLSSGSGRITPVVTKDRSLANRFRGSARGCRSIWFTLAICFPGCTGWLPTQPEPPPIEKTFGKVESSRDTIGIESILIRLDDQQASQLAELWASLDEQVITPDTRMALDRNGLRAAKATGHLPVVLENWVRTSERRRDEDSLEQAGLAADVSSFCQLWRCRPDSRKELTVRRLPHDQATLFYFDGAMKGGTFKSPHFFFSLFTAASGDASALVRLVPEMEYGETKRIVVAKDSAIRTDERRDALAWDSLAVQLRLQRGDCIVIGAIQESRGLGEHFFKTLTKDGDMQHVLLLVRLSELRNDDIFAPKITATTTSANRLLP
ncbi:MAG: hypothetical protein FJ308_06915 [Planctomycetes bacterium]|nr:hypothetical protein [Planctomycetota bacterium]